MKKSLLFLFFGMCSLYCYAQKKVLDHSVYDGWQYVGKIVLSNDGKWIAYNINVQEGDDSLVVQSTETNYKKMIPRGYDAAITGDSKNIIFKIKPFFKDIRQAKIKKKKTEDMPMDSVAIMELGTDSLLQYPNLISYKTPEEKNEWVAVLLKNEPIIKNKKSYQSDKTKDSLKQLIDSLQYIIGTLKPISPDEKSIAANPGKNNNLLLINTSTGEKQTFLQVNDYAFNKKGSHLLLRQNLNLIDTAEAARLILYQLNNKTTDTVLRGGNDFKNLVLSDDGTQAAFIAERFSLPKATEKFYKLWYYKKGMDSAATIVDTTNVNMPKGSTVSEFAKIKFSKSGEKLLFGTMPIRPPKDTTLIDIDKVNLDIWNYKEDYLQPYQLSNQKAERERSFLAVFDFTNKKMTQVGSKYLPNIYEGKLANAASFVVLTDTGSRIASQWIGNTTKDIYSMDIANGKYVPVIKKLNGEIRASWISPSGKYILWYNHLTKNYHVFDGKSSRNITALIKQPLYDEENDMPDYPSPYGVMGWMDGDSFVLIYDRYDIWKVDPSGKLAPINITKNGRNRKVTYRYVQTDTDEDYINSTAINLLSSFDNTSKKQGLAIFENGRLGNEIFNSQPFYYGQLTGAKQAPVLAYTKENYTQSPNLYLYKDGKEIKLSNTNPQQSQYNWGNASLYHWKTFSGKPATGIIYKPENFDSSKKYPVILYFYEKLSDGLYRYIAPTPTPSRLNISFFVSRGYIVMTPDISYTIGHPSKSAYDYIVSSAKDLAKHSWVDAKHIGIQGQSWGGIQVAQLITMTDIFAAAWSGAPVANMTSAYGGIRWQTGLNRQFQYEKSQSRIGATLWEKPELYIENSPLFHLPKVKTPIVIMANDNDGAVPWYQGIELFTGLRRLGKQAWLLNYNGEDHNLIQRKNRKDIQIREQQYFDWLLKGQKPAKWLIEGVPAVNKGNDWGLELDMLQP